MMQFGDLDCNEPRLLAASSFERRLQSPGVSKRHICKHTGLSYNWCAGSKPDPTYQETFERFCHVLQGIGTCS